MKFPARLPSTLLACIYAAALPFAALAQTPAAQPVPASASAGESLRPEIDAPLKAAQAAIQQGLWSDALSRVSEADSVSDKTPYEISMIEATRGAAAVGNGDPKMAAKAYEVVLAYGRLSTPETLGIMKAMGGAWLDYKGYSKAIAWYQRYNDAGGNSPEVEDRFAQAYYLNGDYAEAVGILQNRFTAMARAGTYPSDEQYQLLANCYQKLRDKPSYLAVLEQQVVRYLKKEYWAELLKQVPKQSGFADRLALDVTRLKLATGLFESYSDYADMVQLAEQAGFPAEAQKVIAQGYANGILGTGKDDARDQRLKDGVDALVADDQRALAADDSTRSHSSIALVVNGYNLTLNGKTDQGLALMERGLANKGQLSYPEDAKLHLGIAYLNAGQKAKALAMMQTVQGSDGTADLAKLWIALISSTK